MNSFEGPTMMTMQRNQLVERAGVQASYLPRAVVATGR